MGTDIYLNWDGKTKEEQEAQYTGYSIDAGDKGYLRASIGMANENAVLMSVFSSEYWDSQEDDGVVFDFSKEKYVKLQNLGLKYLLANVVGIEIPLKNELGEKVESLFKGLFGADSVVASKSGGFPSAVMWLDSLFRFFELGMKKQEEGKNPKVYISA